MSKNKMIIGAAALTAIIAVAGVAASSYASDRGVFNGKFKGNFSAEDMEVKKEVWQAQKVAMDEIFANNNYEAWKVLMEEKVTNMGVRAEEKASKINEETFSKMAEMHKLMQAGDYEGVKELKEELGFGGPMSKIGGHKGRGGTGEGVCPMNLAK